MKFTKLFMTASAVMLHFLFKITAYADENEAPLVSPNPTLKLNADYNGMETTCDILWIKGEAPGYKVVFINDVVVIPDQDGKFDYEYELADGKNDIWVTASDGTQILEMKEFMVTKVLPQKKLYMGMIAAVAVVILEIAGFIIYRNKKKICKVIENKKKAIKKNRENENIINKMRRRENKYIIISAAIIIVCILIFYSLCIKNTRVASGSMEPTLMTGDYVFINKLAYAVKDVERGDIICFWSVEYNEYFTKRVVGIPGDHIEFHDGYVYINGFQADESAYIPDGVETNCIRTFDVPDGCVFVLGDNRENSYDSRFFENPYISEKDIIGKFLGIVHNNWKKS